MKISKYITKLIYISFIAIFILNSNIFARSFNGEEIWIAWVDEQFGSLSYGAVANENDIIDRNANIKVFDSATGEIIKLDKHLDTGYGRYKFNYKEDLVDFLKFADPVYFKRWIEIGKSSDKLNSDKDGLPNAWSKYFYENGNTFAEMQDNYIYETYYVRFTRELANNNIDVSGLNSWAKGFLLNVIMAESGRNPDMTLNSFTFTLAFVKDIWVNGMSSDLFINKLYDRVIKATNGISESQGKDAIRRKYEKCKLMYDERIEEYEAETNIGELLYRDKNGIDNYALSRINKENPEIFKWFLSTKRFMDKQICDWFYSLRDSANYDKDFGIKSGELDFTNNTSYGMDTQFNIPNNPNNVIYSYIDGTKYRYIPQNGNEKYGDEKYGSNNIDQSGSLLCCICMGISKIKGISLTPDKLIKETGATNDDNLKSLLNKVNVNIKNISQDKVQNYLSQGNNCVIAKVQDCEFTTKETYIIISNSELIDGQIFVRVINPNINQFETNYKLYSLNYLNTNCSAQYYVLS